MRIIASVFMALGVLVLVIATLLLPFFYLYRAIFGKYPLGIVINGEH